MNEAELEQERMFAEFMKAQEEEAQKANAGAVVEEYNLISNDDQFISDDNQIFAVDDPSKFALGNSQFVIDDVDYIEENIKSFFEEKDEVHLDENLISSINRGDLDRYVDVKEERARLEELERRILSEADEIREKAREEGREEGFNAGKEEGFEQGLKEGNEDFLKNRKEVLEASLEKEISRVSKIFSLFELDLDSKTLELEKIVFNIIKNIIGNIVKYEVSHNDEFIKNSINKSLSMLPSYAKNIVIKISKEDYILAKDYFDNSGMNFEVFDSITAGSCEISSDCSYVRNNIDELIQEAFDNFEEIISSNK